jgi:phosphoglycolate phosphatase
MVDQAVAILGCDREALLDDLKRVHQQHHDSEHPFALLETNAVQSLMRGYSNEDRRRILDPAFKAFNSTRKQNLKLYPDVRNTLEALRDRGVVLIAHSESKVYSVIFRMKFLGITDFFDRIYCLERPFKTLAEPDRARNFLNDFPTQKLVEIKHHERKPNPAALQGILNDFAVSAEHSAYIGDSLAKDVYMAAQVGSCSIWAKYGAQHVASEYKMLVRVSHWTPEEITREAQLRKAAQSVIPDFIAEKSFREICVFF